MPFATRLRHWCCQWLTVRQRGCIPSPFVSNAIVLQRLEGSPASDAKGNHQTTNRDAITVGHVDPSFGRWRGNHPTPLDIGSMLHYTGWLIFFQARKQSLKLISSQQPLGFLGKSRA